jgi:predicted phosphohydrolase
MKYIHITDIHLDHLGDSDLREKEWVLNNIDRVVEYATDLCLENPNIDIVCLTGDISSGQLLPYHLEVLGEVFRKYNKKLLFVCGNHDYYGSSFTETRKAIKQVIDSHKDTLYYLTDNTILQIDDTLIVGHDGWYDGLYAPFIQFQTVEMNDFHVIEDLKDCRTRNDLYNLCRKQAKTAADYVSKQIEWGIISKNPKKVLVLTHIPPFQELSTYKGKVSNNIWLPCYSSKTFGDMLIKTATKYPNINFRVLCGHTHDAVQHLALPNLHGYTGRSKYGMPQTSLSIQEL